MCDDIVFPQPDILECARLLRRGICSFCGSCHAKQLRILPCQRSVCFNCFPSSSESFECRFCCEDHDKCYLDQNEGKLLRLASDINLHNSGVACCAVCVSGVGTSFCVTCDDYYCEKCEKRHNVLHSSHEVQTLQERRQNLPNVFEECSNCMTLDHRRCDEHGGMFERYCQDCKTSYCPLCDHDAHNTIDLLLVTQDYYVRFHLDVNKKMKEIRTVYNAVCGICDSYNERVERRYLANVAVIDNFNELCRRYNVKRLHNNEEGCRFDIEKAKHERDFMCMRLPEHKMLMSSIYSECSMIYEEAKSPYFVFSISYGVSVLDFLERQVERLIAPRIQMYEYKMLEEVRKNGAIYRTIKSDEHTYV